MLCTTSAFDSFVESKESGEEGEEGITSLCLETKKKRERRLFGHLETLLTATKKKSLYIGVQ